MQRAGMVSVRLVRTIGDFLLWPLPIHPSYPTIYLAPKPSENLVLRIREI